MPHYKKQLSYNSKAFKRSLNEHSKNETELTLTTEVIEETPNENDESIIVGLRPTIDS